jgi:hypothetical protein
MLQIWPNKIINYNFCIYDWFAQATIEDDWLA